MNIDSVLFFVNGDAVIGTGHFWRCFYLARILDDRGCKISFISVSLSEPLVETLRDSKYENMIIGKQDLSQFLQGTGRSIVSGKSNLLIIDTDDKSFHSPEFQKLVLDAGWKLMIFSTTADVEYHCHLYVNPNVIGLSQKLHAHPTTKALVGPRYLTFSPGFQGLKRQPEKLVGKKIFICFGGADPCDYTTAILNFLTKGDHLTGLECRIVLGNLHPKFQEIKAMCKGNPSLQVFYNSKEIASIMAECNLAICSPGMVFWELMLLGVKSIILSSSEREKPISKFLGERKVAIAFHQFGDNLTSEKLSELSRLLRVVNEDHFSGFRDVQKEIDTQGAARIADEIQKL